MLAFFRRWDVRTAVTVGAAQSAQCWSSAEPRARPTLFRAQRRRRLLLLTPGTGTKLLENRYAVHVQLACARLKPTRGRELVLPITQKAIRRLLNEASNDALVLGEVGLSPGQLRRL